jgi:hypothetical protein
MQEDQWLDEFYSEVERLFNGILPKGFDIDNMPYCPTMTPHKAAVDFFVGYYERNILKI